MGTRGRKASSSAQDLRAAVDEVIAESLEQDPDRVARVLEAVVERCKEQGRYPADEIDAAAAQLRREFALLPRKVN